jgi:diacylglycerol O-acyltransferase / wax synthase
MQQLSGMDASFVYLETAAAPMHVASVAIYDPSTAPGGRVTFKGILATVEARLQLARAFRQRMVRVPLDLDHPYWIEDGDFDLEFHVRHIALPKPGDWRQLMIQVARLDSRHLDLSRPLWEMYVIEGLDNVENLPPGSFAVMQKTHHAAVDGV